MKLIKIILFSINLTLLVISQPTEQWMKTYNGTGNNTDVLNGMVLDAAGHIYVTGYTRSGNSQTTEDYGTIKYLSDGTRRWVMKYNGSQNYRDNAMAIGVDNECNVYVTGFALNLTQLDDFVTIKYDSAGNQVWLSVYNGVPDPYQWIDRALAIAVKGNGVYVTGVSYNVGGHTSTVRYSMGNGGEVWRSIYTSPDSVLYSGKTIAVDNGGNCFVGAGVLYSTYRTNYVVIKYSASGGQQWVASYNGPANAEDQLNSITLDESGNVYATGKSYGDINSAYDIATVKFAGGGGPVWVARFNGFGSRDDAGYFIRYANNAVYVVGSVRQKWETSSVSDDMVVIKYSLSGSIQWVQYYNSSRNYQDYAVNMAFDRNNNVYVAGHSAEFNNSNYLMHTIKYNCNDGAEQWVKSSGRVNTYATAIGLDTSSNIYAAGYGDNFPANSDYLLKKYSQGNLFAQSFSNNSINKPINDLQNTYDIINVNLPQNNPASTIYKVAVVLDSVLHTNDSDLEFYITHNGITDSLIYRAGGSSDHFLSTRLDDSTLTSVQNGTAPFAGRYKPFSPLGKFIGIDPNGDWTLRIYDYAPGYTGTLNAWHIEISYIPPIGIKQISNEIPVHYYLGQNYPNPFNPVTNIRFAIPSNVKREISNIRIIIFDILGKEVDVLVNEQLQPGTYEVEFDGSKYSSGIYFYILSASENTETKKMILIK